MRKQTAAASSTMSALTNSLVLDTGSHSEEAFLPQVLILKRWSILQAVDLLWPEFLAKIEGYKEPFVLPSVAVKRH